MKKPEKKQNKAKQTNELETLKTQIQQQSEKIENLQHSLQRALADYNNLEKRQSKDVEQLIFNRVADICEDLIEMNDNVDIALQQKQKISSEWVDGIVSIVSGIPKLLEEFGVEPIIPQKGDLFDPQLHEAIAINTGKKVTQKTIEQTVQTGYLLEGKLLRPAKVIVNTK